MPLKHTTVQPELIISLRQYFSVLSSLGCEVLVVDGSPEQVFAAHEAGWKNVCQHVPVDRKHRHENDKVNGVYTGVDLASNEHIVLADEDVRYRPDQLRRFCHLLRSADLVRPQNYYAPLPVWARIDSARMLVFRGALRLGDYPSTCAFRRSVCIQIGHCDGDVLFDNEEFVRHFAANGAAVMCATNLFVQKLPSSLPKWLEQRPRYAFEDFGMRGKTILFASVWPLFASVSFIAGRRGLAVVASAVFSVSAAFAAKGLLRDRAYHYFRMTTVLFAPVWVLERGLSAYIAFYLRVRRGGVSFGGVLLSRGTGSAWSAGRRMAPQLAPEWSEQPGELEIQ